MAAISLRYARAFASVVNSMHLDSSAALEQLQAFGAALDESRPLREFLDDPSAAHEDKLRVVDALGQRLGMLHQVRNLVAVIVSHQRLAEFHEIVSDYASEVNEQSGISEAEITSARPLSEEDRKVLESQIARLAGTVEGKVRATYREDPALLGGAVIRIGSTVYDGSIRAQLNQLKQRMMAAQVS